MAIPQTNLHIGYVVDQIRQNLIGLQRDVNRNAQTHRLMALAQSPPLDKLQSFLIGPESVVASYQKRLQWFEDWIAVANKQTALVNQLAKMQWSLNDITTIQDAVELGVAAFNSAKKDDYVSIIAACDQLILDVNDPESLWPQ